MVYPPQYPPGTAFKEQRLGQGSLSRVHMGKKPHIQGAFFGFGLPGHTKPPSIIAALIIAYPCPFANRFLFPRPHRDSRRLISTCFIIYSKNSGLIF